MKIFYFLFHCVFLFYIPCLIQAQEIPSYFMQDAIVNDCEGILFDSGGPTEPYNNEEELTFTICPDQPHTCLRLLRDSSVIENNFDFISFYDGPAINPRDFLGSFSGNVPPVIDVFSGCLTIHFVSDNSNPEKGWMFHWQCSADACPGLPVNPQDCLGAIPICQNQYFEENAYQGTGFFPEEINPENSCLKTGEKNDVWYVFTVQESGLLNFTITPNNLTDDYDWAIFNLTEQECTAIFDLPALEVSCDFVSTPGPTGPNGLDGMQNEPEVAVLAGETYVINVSQFSSSTAGYAIDFSASSAIIFDDIPPDLTTVSPPNCGENHFGIRFSENVLCSSVMGNDFELIGPTGQSYTLINKTPICITDPNAYENRYELQLAQTLTISGTYRLRLIGDITDICGNTTTAPNTRLSFNVALPPFVGIINDIVVCENEAAVIQGDTTTSFQFYTAIGVHPDQLLGTGSRLIVTEQVPINEPTNFLITQTIAGCESEAISVSVTRLANDNAGFALPDVICSSPDTPNPIPQLAPDANGNGFFSINNNGIIDSLSGLLEIAQMSAGEYIVTYTTQSNCPNSSSQTISLLPDFSIEIDTANVNCLADNNQFEFMVTINSEAVAATYQIKINDLEQTLTANTPASFVLIAQEQNYELIVSTSDGLCTKSKTIRSPNCTVTISCQTATAGSLTTTVANHLCFGDTVQVKAINAIVPEDHLLTYVLHDGTNENIGNVIAFNENGGFTAPPNATNIVFYKPYLISSLVGIDTNDDGLPELSDSCTVNSIGTAITFLAPITIKLTQTCDPIAETFLFHLFATGGLPQLLRTTTYQIIGTTTQQLAFGDITSFLLPFAAIDSTYHLTLTDAMNCSSQFTEVILACSTTPIELLQFVGNPTTMGNELTWITASEYNNAYFQLLHSTDGTLFTPLTLVSSQGNSSTEQGYSFLHPNTSSGIHYYQLHQTDWDGSTTHQTTISINRKTPTSKITFFPQPTTDWVNLNWQQTTDRAIQFKLYDISGKIITTQSFSNPIHSNSTQRINLSAYNTGVYFIEINTLMGNVIREKLVKQ